MTLYSASRLINPSVRDDRHFIYFEKTPAMFSEFLKELEVHLGLLKLIKGGNVCVAVPYYASSVLRDARTRKGQPVVSDLQLYLDLMGFPPVGEQEVRENLWDIWKEKRVSFV